MSEGGLMQERESTSRVIPEIPEVKLPKETPKQKRLKDINEKTSAMAHGYLMPGDFQNKFPEAMTSLIKNTSFLTEMADSEYFQDFETAIDTASNFLRFYDEQDQETKDILQTSNSYEIKEFADFSISLLSNEMERIGQEIKRDNVGWEQKSKLMSAVVSLATVGEGINREKAVEYLVGNLDILSRVGLEDNSRGGLISLDRLILFPKVLDIVLKRGNPAQTESAKQWIMKIIKENSNDSLKRYVVKQIELIRGWEISSQTVKSHVIASIISAFDINGEQAVDAWDQARNVFDSTDSAVSSTSGYYENLSALLELESQRHGVGRVLQQEFGINDFARYPHDLLIAQYDQRNIKDNLPHGVIVYGAEDYNGASYSNAIQLESLFNQLQGKCRIRVWEVKNLPGIVRVLNKSRHEYGKISFAIVNAHGTPENIRFGGDDSIRNKLDKTDIARSGIDSLKLAFIDNPTVILNSCSTGQLGGIGQEISKIGANIIAPIAPTNLDSIRVSILDDGSMNFDVKYRKDVSISEFSLGKKVEK